MRRFFWMSGLALLLATGCGGGSGGPSLPITVVMSPTLGQSINMGATLQINATVPNDRDGRGVTWNLSGDGALLNPTVSSVTYVAPNSVSENTNVVVTATAVATGSSVGYLPLTILPVNTLANVQPVVVDGGPVAGQIYPNAGFTSVTVCTPGTVTCKTIGGILVDTSSTGLRILSSALPSLPALMDSSGNTIGECFQSSDQSYIWGNVAIADVRIGGEVVRSISIHAIADSSTPSIPSDCSADGAGTSRDTQQTLGANGILGVGLEPQDCGKACDPSAGGTAPGPAYYSCSGTACNAAFVALAQQVTHPAVLFPKDNNGVALQFQQLSGVATTLTGSLVFGINTQPNNTLTSETVFTVDAEDNFTANVNGQSFTSSFIDSGSNRFGFTDMSLQRCSGSDATFYCPPSSTMVTATNVGANDAQGTINFNVDNADHLLQNNPTAAAFSALAGSNDNPNGFEWGLPFFFGRNVFVAIRGQKTPLGAPANPWWAYDTGFNKN